MLTTMRKNIGGERRVIHGHLTAREVYELKQEGWKLVSRDKPVRQNKNGIPIGRAV